MVLGFVSCVYNHLSGWAGLGWSVEGACCGIMEAFHPGYLVGPMKNRSGRLIIGHPVCSPHHRFSSDPSPLSQRSKGGRVVQDGSGWNCSC